MWVLLGWLWCVGKETTFKDQDKREWWSLVIKSWVAGSPFTSSMEEFKNVPLLSPTKCGQHFFLFSLMSLNPYSLVFLKLCQRQKECLSWLMI